MFRYHFKYELISLIRNRWIQILSILLLGLCLFAAYNGQQKVEKRAQDIAQAQVEVQEGDSLVRILLDSLEAGYEVNVSPWRRPDQATAVGNYHPRVAAMPPSPLALVATGQSDIYTHYVKPTITGDDFALNFTELSSPVQLLFGSFDLAFVMIFLLPLVTIAFSYNLLSAEKEQGSLRLLASQPLSLYTWVLQKASLRFGVLTLLVSISLLLALLFQGVPVLAAGQSVGNTLLLIWVYLLLWFSLALLVNLTGKSSANNAINLLALWVVFVLLLPSSINQLANSIYPVPSRTQMIHNMRVMKVEADEEQDKILNEFLRNHPELASQSGSDAEAYGWWERYFASQELVRQKMQPIVAQYEQQLANQQQWINQLRFLSPAILLQDGFQEIAQTSSLHYQDYRGQVIAFAQAWRNFLLPMIFKGQKVSKETMDDLPTFAYQTASLPSHLATNLWATLFYVLLLLGGGLLWYRARSTAGVLAS